MSVYESLSRSVSEVAERHGGRVVPLKYLFRRTKSTGSGTEELLSLYREHGVVPKSSRDDNFNRASDDLSNYQLVEPGDLVVNKMKAWQGSVAISQHRGIVSPAYFVYQAYSEVPGQYLHYVLRSAPYRQVFGSISSGVRPNQWDLDPAAFERLPVPVLPVDKARAIADYLDHETAEIDTLVADLELIRQRSEEHRWSKLGASLGYPAEFLALWERSTVGLASLKHLGSVSLGKMLDTAPPGTEDHLLPYLRAANVQPDGALHLTNLKQMRFTPVEKERLALRAGDVVVVEGGVGGFGRAAYVREELPDVGYQNSIVRFRPDEKTDGRYVTYCLLHLRQAGYISTVASVTSMPHYTAEKVAETPIPRVSLEEQRAIADALDREWFASEEVEADISAAVSLALERRSALISAVVTGQVEVPNRMKPVAEGLEDEIREMR